MNETLTLLPACVAGGVLGAIFFGGLWWTVRKVITSKQPAYWFFGSFPLRIGVTLAGFYYVSGTRWDRMAACLAGFALARVAVTWLTRVRERPARAATETNHAS